ncbi:MAG TPA: serine hydrolase domain-containing protein, partial [Acidobacteriota bacterium]
MSLKRSLSVSLLLIFIISGAAASGLAADSRLPLPPSPQGDLASQIDAILAQTYKPGEPGAAVLVKKGGQVLFRRGYGLANLELNVPVEPDMVFRLGSITKQFTAVAVLMLAEQGKLSLQDDLSKFLPDFPTQGRTITIEHLLTHTSGIKSYTEIPGWLSLWRKDMSVKEIIDLFRNVPLEFEPGQRWKYSNSGYILLGAVIEKISGQAYEDFIRKNIFEPLGLAHSCYDRMARIIPRRVPGYSLGRAGFENAQFISMTQPYAAG